MILAFGHNQNAYRGRRILVTSELQDGGHIIINIRGRIRIKIKNWVRIRAGQVTLFVYFSTLLEPRLSSVKIGALIIQLNGCSVIGYRQARISVFISRELYKLLY